MHYVHRLVQTHLKVRFFGKQRVVSAYDRTCSRMYGEDAVILGDLLGEGYDLIHLGISVRLIHESQRSSESSALHGLPDVLELLLDLFRSIGRRIVAGHSRTNRALTDKWHQIDVEPALGPLLKLLKAAGRLSIEKPSAHLVSIWCIRVYPEGREAAVSCDLSGDTLLDEGLIEHLRIVTIVEEIVMGVSVDQPRADLKARDVDHHVARFVYDSAHLNDHIVLNQHIALIGLIPGSVYYGSILKKRLHI